MSHTTQYTKNLQLTPTCEVGFHSFVCKASNESIKRVRSYQEVLRNQKDCEHNYGNLNLSYY